MTDLTHPPTTPDQPTESTLVIPVDPEPVLLRLILLIVLIVAVIAGYIVVDAIIPSSSINFIAIIGSIVIAAGVLRVAETVLKNNWTPTRFVHVRADAVQVVSGDKVERTIDPMQQVNTLLWHFEIKKRSRAPKGWHMVALSLEQDEYYLPVYTLASPEDFHRLNSGNAFTRLEAQRRTDSPLRDRDVRLSGLQRRLHTAEGARGFEGAEMLLEDFERYLHRLEELFPKWMPSIGR